MQDILDKAKKAFSDTVDKGTGLDNVPLMGEAPRAAERYYSKSSVAAMAIVTKDYMHICPNQACHAGLDNTGYTGHPGKKPSNIIAVLSYVQDMNHKDREVIRYYDWLVNRSPWAACFIEKSATKIVKERMFVCRADVPSNILGGGLQATRMPTEYSSVLPTYLAAVDAGLNESLAYWLGVSFTISDDKKLSWRPMSGHCATDSYQTGEDGIGRFLRNKPNNLNANYNVSTSYDGIHKMWSEGNMAGKKLWMSVLGKAADLDKGVVKRSVVKAITNPFAKAFTKPVENNRDDDMPKASVTSVCKVLKEIFNA